MTKNCTDVFTPPKAEPEPVLAVCGVMVEVPSSNNMSAAEYLPRGKGLHRRHIYGWFDYYPPGDGCDAFVEFRPLFSCTLPHADLLLVLNDPAVIQTPELQAMASYYEFAEGMFVCVLVRVFCSLLVCCSF